MGPFSASELDSDQATVAFQHHLLPSEAKG
jgi:hypothetical protein